MNRKIASGIGAIAAGTLLVLGGCASEQASTERTSNYSPPTRFEMAYWVESPRAVPEPERAAPVEQPVAAAQPPAPTTSRAANTGPFAGSRYHPKTGPGTTVSELAFPTGDPATSPLLIHQVLPNQVRVGQPYAYQVHVTNTTDGTLQNVLVKLENSANMVMTGSNPPSTKGDDGVTQWVIGDLAGRSTSVIEVEAKAEKIGNSTACVSASYNNALCAGTQVVEPALMLTKSVPAEAILCDPITIKYVVRNSGSGAAEGVRIRDTLAAGLTTVDGRTSIDMDVGTISAGQSKEFVIQVKAAKVGTYESAATAMGTGGLTAEAAGTATLVRRPVLTLNAECPEGTLLGRSATFKFIVTNTSDVPAPSAVLTAPLPNGTTFAGADNGGTSGAGKVTWSLGTLAPKASRTVTLSVQGLAEGTLQASATAAATCAEPVQASCEASIRGVADIGTMLTDREGVVLVGDAHTYYFEVENQGQIILTNVKATFEFEDGMSYVSTTGITAPTTTPTTADRKVEFKIGALKPKEKRAFQVVVKSSKAGEFRMTSLVTADQIKNPAREDEITVFVDR